MKIKSAYLLHMLRKLCRSMKARAMERAKAEAAAEAEAEAKAKALAVNMDTIYAQNVHSLI